MFFLFSRNGVWAAYIWPVRSSCDILLFISHNVPFYIKKIFLFRGNAASASEMTVDCTELRRCNQEPLHSGIANEQCLMWQEKNVSTFLWPTLLNKLQTSKTTYWRKKAWPKTAIWVSGLINLLSGREPWHLSQYLLYYWYLFYSELDGKLWKWKWNFWDAAGRSRADTGGGTGGWREREGIESRKPWRGQEECSLCCNFNH